MAVSRRKTAAGPPHLVASSPLPPSPSTEEGEESGQSPLLRRIKSATSTVASAFKHAVSLGDGVNASGETVAGTRSARAFSIDHTPWGDKDGDHLCAGGAAASMSEDNYHARAKVQQLEKQHTDREEEDSATSSSFYWGVAYVLLAALAWVVLRWCWGHDGLFERLGARAAAWDTGMDCAADAAFLNRESVQRLTSCWGTQFRALQTELSRGLREARLHDEEQTPAYLNCVRACAVVVLWGVAWGVVYLDVIPAALFRSARAKVFSVLQHWLALTALLALALAFVPYGILLHLDLQELCGTLQRKHEGFYAELQRAAVFSVHVPPHDCTLLQRHASLDLWGVGAVLGNRAFTFFFIIPCLKVLQQAWSKSKNHFRLRREAKKRYCDVVNFSVTMYAEDETAEGEEATAQDAAGGSSGEGGPSLSLRFRTLCEMPTSKLVHNWHTLQLLKMASRCTTHEFPLLHTLSPEEVSAVNLLCLNQISELVGADYFAMNEPKLIPSHMRDYCFALTCERYTHANHEDKLRCIVVKKDVLDQIVRRVEPFHRRDKTPDAVGKWLKLERKNHSWRWNTTMAMAFAFADEACDGPKAVWSVQIPVHAPRSELSKEG